MEHDPTTPAAMAAAATAQPARRGAARLATDIALDTSRLVRLELALVKAEVAEQAKVLGSGVAMVAAGVFVLLVAFPILVASLVLGLAEWMPAWASALAVGGLLLLVAGILVALGARRARRGADLAPSESIESARQDLQWLQRRLTFDATSKR